MLETCRCGCGGTPPEGARSFCIGHWNRPCRSPEEYRAWKPARDASRAQAKRVHSRAYQAERRKTIGDSPAIVRRNALWHLYRIRPEEYDTMLLAQGGACAICRTKQPAIRPHATGEGKGRAKGNERTLCVDHVKGEGPHHARTAPIRGLLCSKCNFSIGLLDHDTKKLANAIEYLNRAPSLRALRSLRSELLLEERGVLADP